MPVLQKRKLIPEVNGRDKTRALKRQTHRPQYPLGYVIFLLLKLLTHDIQNVKNKIRAICDIFAFYFPPSPHQYICPRSKVALSWKVTFAGGQADGSSHRQAQFSSLTMCHSKALKISVLDTPSLLLNLGH